MTSLASARQALHFFDSRDAFRNGVAPLDGGAVPVASSLILANGLRFVRGDREEQATTCSILCMLPASGPNREEATGTSLRDPRWSSE